MKNSPHPDCPRFSKWIRGCKFEARYEDGAMKTSHGELSGTPEAVIAYVNALKRKVYVRDVCTTCGKTIERLTQ